MSAGRSKTPRRTPPMIKKTPWMDVSYDKENTMRDASYDKENLLMSPEIEEGETQDFDVQKNASWKSSGLRSNTQELQ